MKTTERIIQLLKVNGSMTAKALSNELEMTTMGVRQHLQLLEDSQEVVYQDKKAARGRPTRSWSLTEKSNEHFADGHQELTLQLIDSVKTIFGDKGLDKLILQREKESFNLYDKSLKEQTSLKAKLDRLAELRTNEGYMATIEEDGDVFWLMENHCPICAAASKCQNFCRSELELFQNLLQDVAKVSREEHIIEGARRCAYRIIPL